MEVSNHELVHHHYHHNHYHHHHHYQHHHHHHHHYQHHHHHHHHYQHHHHHHHHYQHHHHHHHHYQHHHHHHHYHHHHHHHHYHHHHHHYHRIVSSYRITFVARGHVSIQGERWRASYIGSSTQAFDLWCLARFAADIVFPHSSHTTYFALYTRAVTFSCYTMHCPHMSC